MPYQHKDMLWGSGQCTSVTPQANAIVLLTHLPIIFFSTGMIASAQISCPYAHKTQPLSRSCLEKGLRDSVMRWIEPVPRHFETIRRVHSLIS
jgi:hypothetical protein